MEKKESIYSEVNIEFYNDIEQNWCVDTWKTDNSDEEGVVVARINLKGEIEWEVEEAKNDPLVKEEIERFFDDKLFSIKDAELLEEKLSKIFKNTYSGQELGFDVINPDGCVTYGFEKKYILDCLTSVVGMMGNGNFKMIPDATDKDYSYMARWLIADIESAVDEVFVISL